MYFFLVVWESYLAFADIYRFSTKLVTVKPLNNTVFVPKSTDWVINGTVFVPKIPIKYQVAPIKYQVVPIKYQIVRFYYL